MLAYILVALLGVASTPSPSDKLTIELILGDAPIFHPVNVAQPA